MKNFAKLAALGAALAVAAPFASATTITANGVLHISSFPGSISMTGTGSALTFTFVNPASTSLASGTGTFSPYVAPAANTANFSTFTTGGPYPAGPVLTITENGETTSFYATGSSLVFSQSGTFEDVLLTGYVTENGVTVYSNNNNSMLEIDATGLSSGGPASSFSATLTAPTPEPSSLMLLGSGFLSAGGMLIRRRKMAA